MSNVIHKQKFSCEGLKTRFCYKENDSLYKYFLNLYVQKNIVKKDYNDLKRLFFKLIPEELFLDVGNRGDDRVQLGLSTKKNLTVMFLDIIGFSSIAENLSSEDSLALLNSYFDGILRIIKENGGYIDKFLGDGIMILFDEDHTDKCIKSAIEIQKFILKSKKENIKHLVGLGVGINSGEVTIGTIGAAERMEITVIGDTVNIASRLEGLTREYHNKIIISEGSYDLLSNKNEFSIEKIGKRHLKGKNKEINIYGITGLTKKV